MKQNMIYWNCFFTNAPKENVVLWILCNGYFGLSGKRGQACLLPALLTVCGLCNKMHDRFVDYAIRCKTSLWNMQYNARQVCRICNTMQVCGICNTMHNKSAEYAIQCITSLRNMQYDARQVCGICNTMQNRSVKYAIRCQTNIPNQQHSKLHVHTECTAWRVPVSTEGSTRSLSLTSTA